MSKEEFSIMNNNPPMWYNKRFTGSHRHEVFFGKNRQKSIEDGLVVFLTPVLHNMSDSGVHFNKKFRDNMQKEGQKRWMKYYKKTKEDFIKRYGKNYL